MPDNLILQENPTLKNFQEYVHKLEIDRGFFDQDVLQKCLLLGEEIGELFKAVRKMESISIDKKNSKITNVEGELADILIYICSIPNRYEIDLESAFRTKEEVNKNGCGKSKYKKEDRVPKEKSNVIMMTPIFIKEKVIFLSDYGN